MKTKKSNRTPPPKDTTAKPAASVTTDSPFERRADKSNKLMLLLVFTGIVVAAVVGYFLLTHSLPNNPSAAPDANANAEVASNAQQAASEETSFDANNALEVPNEQIAVSEVAAPTSETDEIQSIDTDVIINAEIPNDPALAREEIDRLEDETRRYAEQEQMLAEQVAMMDELTQKKAEQIELLEQQIAQLEAQQTEAN